MRAGPTTVDGERPAGRSGSRRLPLRWVAAAIVLTLVALATLTPLGRYLVQAGIIEAGILARRQPIAAIIADSATAADTRQRLRLVLSARDFAADSLGLDAGGSYRTYSPVRRDTLVLVLSAAYRDRLERYTWWFPIVGRVPYKGFFDFDRARSDAAHLEEDGYDVYLRPSAAFSTLGWFDDPLLSTVLAGDTIGLVNTVIHEIAHNTYYAPSGAVFNESFANFVGARGAEAFFLSRGADSAAALAARRWREQRVMGRFWAAVAASLDSAYAAHPESRERRIAARDVVYLQARRRLREQIAPALDIADRTWPDRLTLNNAALLARRVYLTELELFDLVLDRHRGDVRAAIARIIALARAAPADPFEALRGWVGSAAEAAAQNRP